ncbi:VOC family protein [Pseudacidobacterium ailaaui]|jgi:PhnB protein|uniref:VOC family protein n=1 Tax=Pseudacidobacterium ailaaui TaxID=1382359 RepID=UPI00047A1764|nr:VOC family protein [Pseudacidobacterium ailaaui]
METTEARLIPHLTVSDAAAAIDFYKKAFNAVEVARHIAPDGKRIMHARVELFGSALMLNDDFCDYTGGKSNTPEALSGSPVTLHLQVDDARRVWDLAVAAGAKVVMPLQEQFWGDIYGMFIDPFGHKWSVGETVKKLSETQIQEGAKQAFGHAPRA